jgi:hypothetical protein
LLVFDFRNDYAETHIRDSFHVHPGLNRGIFCIKKEEVIEVIELADRKAREK